MGLASTASIGRLVLACVQAAATDYRQTEVACPNGGQKFTAHVTAPTSGSCTHWSTNPAKSASRGADTASLPAKRAIACRRRDVH
jgi:hypothetical protein